jgi:hypothetical protein
VHGFTNNLGGIIRFLLGKYVLLVVLSVFVQVGHSYGQARKPYVGRWETQLRSGQKEVLEFTADGRFFGEDYSFPYQGTYVEESPGILHIKFHGRNVFGMDGDGDLRLEYEREGSCLLITTEKNETKKYFPIPESERAPDADSESDEPKSPEQGGSSSQRTMPTDAFGRNLLLSVKSALDTHDWKTLTGMTVDGQVSYFGHNEASNDSIQSDLESDSRTYASVHSSYYPDTFIQIFNHGRTSDGNPIMIASMNFYTEARENGGKLHKAKTRFFVSYAVDSAGHTAIYYLASNVLKN